MTKDNYTRLVLESAAADGEIDAPQLTDTWLRLSLLIGMYMQGLIERRGEGRMYDRAGPWYITESGRAAAALSPQPAQKNSP